MESWKCSWWLLLLVLKRWTKNPPKTLVLPPLLPGFTGMWSIKLDTWIIYAMKSFTGSRSWNSSISDHFPTHTYIYKEGSRQSTLSSTFKEEHLPATIYFATQRELWYDYSCCKLISLRIQGNSVFTHFKKMHTEPKGQNYNLQEQAVFWKRGLE